MHGEFGPRVNIQEETVEKIRAEFADRLDKESRKVPGGRVAEFLGPEIGERVISGERAPSSFLTEEILVQTVRDFGLPRDAFLDLKERFLERKSSKS